MTFQDSIYQAIHLCQQDLWKNQYNKTISPEQDNNRSACKIDVDFDISVTVDYSV